jgi:hypothetical protein
MSPLETLWQRYRCCLPLSDKLISGTENASGTRVNHSLCCFLMEARRQNS